VLTVGSLFSGIGGMDLGLERAGLKVIWQSEIDPYCCKVLKKHWPEVPNHGDIRTIEWERIKRPDVICGGYPCQPFSAAGKRRGEQDPRHLWPLMLDAIRHFRPRYAVMENVRGHLSLGFGTVLGDLANLGFNAEWQVLPASAFGAPHRRDRLFIVAYPDDTRNGTPERNLERQIPTSSGERQHAFNEFGGRGAILADTESKQGNGGRNGHVFGSSATNWLQGSVGRKSGNEWKSNWEIEPDVGRVANGISHRVDRLKGLGNAVVPQIAEFLGHLIIQHSK
jgi:DNA (cytosine-5)-methyltransferase 1